MRGELKRLCAEIGGGEGSIVHCDAAGVVPAGLADVELLARLRLIVRRQGRALLVSGATAALREIVSLAGLVDVLTTNDDARP